MRKQPLHTFGAQLRHFRQTAGLTQEQLAERSGLTVNGISQLERGERRSPYPQTIQALADALGLSEESHAGLIALASRRNQLPTATPASSLPRYTNSLIGRQNLLALAQDLLLRQGTRLLTIIGPAGVGKTSLALQLGSLVETEAIARDGVVFVPLTAIASTADLPLAIVQALAVASLGIQPLIEQILVVLQERIQLLILDAAEQLFATDRAEFTALISQILDTAPGIRIITTAGEALQIHDEALLQLEGLALPVAKQVLAIEEADAVRLFIERARQHQPTFTIQNGGQAAIAQICQQLAGLPLAIELAAAWIPSRTPKEIAAGLEAALAASTSAQDRPIQAALVYTWALLTPQEQRTLAQLAVFQGGCDRTAAEQILRTNLRTMTALVDKGLVWRIDQQGTTRYTMHALVRQYAQMRLAGLRSEQMACEKLHTSYYLNLLQRAMLALTGVSRPDAYAMLERERDNLHAVWQRALATHDSPTLQAIASGMRMIYDDHEWLIDGAKLFGHAAKLLQQSEATTTVQARLLGIQAYFLVRAGQFLEAKPILEQAWQLTTDQDFQERGELHYNSGIIALRSANMTDAREHFSQANQLAHEAGDQFLSTWAEHWQAVLELLLGEYSKAERLFLACIASWRSRHVSRGEALDLVFLGENRRAAGQPERAIIDLQEAIRVASLAHNETVLNIALATLGAIVLARGAIEEAHYLLVESVAGLRLIGDAWPLGRALIYLIQVEIQRHQFMAAQRATTELVQLVIAGEALLLADASYSVARLCYQHGQLIEALALLIAIEAVFSELETAQHIHSLQLKLTAQLNHEQYQQATEWAEQRSLIPWLADLCSLS